jgi:hypothetical protein
MAKRLHAVGLKPAEDVWNQSHFYFPLLMAGSVVKAEKMPCI